MSKYQTSPNPRTVTAGKRLAVAYRKQNDLGLDGEPRRRLSLKQLAFLRAIAATPRYDVKLPLICIDRMPDEIWFTFLTEKQAYKWVRNLADRGFVVIEQDCFARITAQGMEATK